MAAQLTFLGTWEPVVSEPAVVEPTPAPPQPEPVDPRQVWLLDGPHSVRQEAEHLCEKLDAAALRAVWRKAKESYPTWPGSSHWPAWADGIEHLLGTGATISAQEQLARAIALDGATTMRGFPEMPAALRSRVRSTALCQAAERLLQQEGMAARLPDGRPAGYLQLLAGMPAKAVSTLENQKTAWAEQGDRGLLLGYLGEALWRCDRGREALYVYRDAYLEEPTSVDERELTCTPILELLDACAELELPENEKAWLPVVADLLGKIPLSSGISASENSSAARVAATLLSAYRQRQSEGMEDVERIRRKREILKLAPGLKEHLRRL